MQYKWTYLQDRNKLRDIENKQGYPGGSDGEESACGGGDQGLIPGSGRCPEEWNGNPLQYSCLENPTGGGAWQATVTDGVTKSRTQLRDFTFFLSRLPKRKGGSVRLGVCS